MALVLTTSEVLSGSGTSYTISNAPLMPTSSNLQIFRQGQLQAQGTDYTISGTAITWLYSTTDTLIAWYNYTSTPSYGSTITLQGTMGWASAFVDFTELYIGANNEPSITTANTILQTILGPPFKWNFNRSSVSFSTVQGTQDYAESVSSFGFIEDGSLTDSSSKTFAFTEIKQILTIGTEQGRPKSIAAYLDNGSGTITFRMLPVPDAAYTTEVYFQQSPALIASLSSTWAPIPDKFSYIYNWGFLALTMAYDDDPRFPIFNQKFVASLLGAQQGLTESERNLFMDTWNLIARQGELRGIKETQGRQALGT